MTMIILSLLTFSGNDKLSDFSINIVGGRLLEYKVVGPVSSNTSDQLHAEWIDGKGERKKLANYHRMLKCFDSMLSSMRRHDSRVETSAMIPMNMKVETRPEIYLLSFPNTTARIIYVILRGPARRTQNLYELELIWEQ